MKYKKWDNFKSHLIGFTDEELKQMQMKFLTQSHCETCQCGIKTIAYLEFLRFKIHLWLWKLKRIKNYLRWVWKYRSKLNVFNKFK